MIGYKLFYKRKNGTYGPLFINRTLQLRIGEVYSEENHPTKGFAVRPGWHICSEPSAPHLSKSNRVWCKVEFEHKETMIRPKHQGGIWYLGKTLKILQELNID